MSLHPIQLISIAVISIGIGSSAGWYLSEDASANTTVETTTTSKATLLYTADSQSKGFSQTETTEIGTGQNVDQVVIKLRRISEQIERELPAVLLSGHSVGPISFEVKETDSLIPPYTGTISFRQTLHVKPDPKRDVRWEMKYVYTWTIRYAFQNNSWVLRSAEFVITEATETIESDRPNSISASLMRASSIERTNKLKGRKREWFPEDFTESDDRTVKMLGRISNLGT